MKWEQVCRWVEQSGDVERRGSLRASGGQIEDGRSEEFGVKDRNRWREEGFFFF